MRVRTYLVLIVLAVTVVFLNLPISASLKVKRFVYDNIDPLHGAAIQLVNGTKNLLGLPHELKSARKKNAELLEQVSQLSHEIRQLRNAEVECDQLRKLLGFRERQTARTVLCSVVGRGDVSGWWETIRLNRGAESGIGEDMAVVTTDGLVGKTISVSRESCKVLMITDPNCRVSCRFVRTGGFGIMKGRGFARKAGNRRLDILCAPKPGVVEYVPKDQRLKEGDPVVTSGLGGVYPASIPVGEIVEVRMDASGLYQEAEIVPAADLAELDYVFVVLNGS